MDAEAEEEATSRQRLERLRQAIPAGHVLVDYIVQRQEVVTYREMAYVPIADILKDQEPGKGHWPRFRVWLVGPDADPPPCGDGPLLRDVNEASQWEDECE